MDTVAVETLKPSPALPMAETFFTGAILSDSLTHGYVLKGKATGALYNLALQIAKIVNCKQRPNVSGNPAPKLADLACGQCKDCRWVSQNAHPAVLTVSRFTYQVSDKDRPDLLTTDELEKLAQKANWPTLIKTDQMGHLIYQLGISSEYTRVVIFTDAEELPASFVSDVIAPSEWRSLEATADRSFHIRPLQRNIFNANSVNRFLKTLEEPPARTLFFFISETEEQLLETIVSRCQVVPCLSEGIADDEQAVLPEVQTFLEGFLQNAAQNQDAYALGAEFEAFFVEQGLSMAQALELLQLTLRRNYLQKGLSESAFSAYVILQRQIDTALRMMSAKTNEGQSVFNLFLGLGPSVRILLAG